MDGAEFVGRLRRHRGEAEDPTTVIAITAFPDDHRGEVMHDLGFKSYLVKPVNPERVAREVLAVYSYGRPAADDQQRPPT